MARAMIALIAHGHALGLLDEAGRGRGRWRAAVGMRTASAAANDE